MSRGKSLLSEKKECYICRTTLNLECHHIYFGTANRKKSDVDGCWCWLCHKHHTGQFSPHQNREIDLGLKEDCEWKWLESHGMDKEAFIKRFGRNYQ